MDCVASGAQEHVPPSSHAGCRILLVEDHPIVSRGLIQLLTHERDMQVCGVAEDCGSAIRLIETLQPDLVILDLSLKTGSGLDVLRHLQARHLRHKVLVLSVHDELVYAPRVLKAGASGYLMKQEAGETLLRAIREVLANGTYLSQRMRKLTLPARGQSKSALSEFWAVLSERELEVFRLIGSGASLSEIAQQLGISVKTAESHRTQIRKKLGLTSMTSLVQRALETVETHGQIRNSKPQGAN